MPSITVLDSNAVEQTVQTLPSVGTAAASASIPVTKSIEDKAVEAACNSNIAIIAGAMTAGQAAMAASHPVVIASDQSAVAVKTSQRVVSVEVTRPTNTDSYNANDVWGPDPAAVITLADLFAANGGSGYITKVELEGNQATDVLPYRIWFFNEAPSAIADGSSFTLLYADVGKRIGYVDINNMASEGSGSDASAGLWTGQLSAKAAASSNNGYAVIVIKAAQTTPPSGKRFTLKVTLDSNG